MDHYREAAPATGRTGTVGMQDFWEAVNGVCDRHGIPRNPENPPVEPATRFERQSS